MSESKKPLVQSRLALRIYLVGLAQFAVVAFGLFALFHANRAPHRGPNERFAKLFSAALAPMAGDPAKLDGEVQRARDELSLAVTVIGPDGDVIASAAPPGAPRCAEPNGKPIGEGRGCGVAPMTFPDGRVGHVECRAPGPPPPDNTRTIGVVLVVVGVSSWLIARWLTRPLRRLSDAARAFGGGDLAVRTGLTRKDELGDVGRAFDEMATRIAELLRSERELLANVSHELRTPLARIRMALALVQEGDAETAKESIVDIAEDLDELERLISDILTAARLDLGDGATPAGIPPLRRESVDLKDLIERAATRFRARHSDRELRVREAKEQPAIDADPVLLRRVVENLLENAHKYSPRADASIEVGVQSKESGRVVIEVTDRGVGIAPEDLARVFRPFFRVDKSRTRATGGLGLGLALAKRIVEAHGGTIELVSKKGEGTRAVVSLPVA